MTALEIDKDLSELMLQKRKESEAKLLLLDKEAKNERKAVQIEVGMYNLLLCFGQLYHLKKGDTYEKQRNHVLWLREKLIIREELFLKFPKIQAAYQSADEEEKKRIIAALQGEMLMRHSFYTNYSKELQAARRYNDVNKAFEIGLKVSVLEDGFKIWEDYRRENGIYCDMF